MKDNQELSTNKVINTMNKTAIIGVLVAAFLLVGALFVTAQLGSEEKSVESEPVSEPVVEGPSCSPEGCGAGSSCGGTCGGSCGVSTCGCGK